MGLLSKSNPKATWRSVIRHAVLTSAIGTTLYGLIVWWYQWLANWPLKVAICAILLMLVAGLWEWQVPTGDGLSQD